MEWRRYMNVRYVCRSCIRNAFVTASLMPVATCLSQASAADDISNAERVGGIASREVASNAPNVLIVLGASGTAEYGAVFRSAGEKWKTAFRGTQVAWIDGTQVEKSSYEIAGIEDDRGLLLKHLETMVASGLSVNVENVGHSAKVAEDELEQKGQSAAHKVRWLVLIGHGTSDSSGHKFNLRGPDIEAKDIAKVLEEDSGRWVIVNAFSSSGPFLERLSASNRVVITATKSGAEHNYSRFATHLAESIADPASDMNHDATVSVLEAFLMASSQVARFYLDEKRLATEQALIDDNGDKRGTPANFYRGLKPAKAPAVGLQMDGDLARRIAVQTLATDYELTAESNEKAQQIEEEIAALKIKKDELGVVAYQQELEVLLLRMADVLGVSQE